MAKFRIAISARFEAARALVQDLPITIAHIGYRRCEPQFPPWLPGTDGTAAGAGPPTRQVAKGRHRLSIAGL